MFRTRVLTSPGSGDRWVGAPPSIGNNLRLAVDEIAAANGVTNRVTHLVYSHHHADHAGAASLPTVIGVRGPGTTPPSQPDPACRQEMAL
jgi:glyoxylase-like metal-dependent hydrolase (beta-lactamase superfamily II)